MTKMNVKSSCKCLAHGRNGKVFTKPKRWYEVPLEIIDTCHLVRKKYGKIVVRVEPSKRLSAILGFPFYIEKSFPLSAFGDLLTKEDLEKMERGEEIQKSIPSKR